MRVIRKTIILTLFIVPLLAASACATMATLLPESSHYDGSIAFSEVVNGKTLEGRIDFAVYDTLGGNEYVDAGFTAPGNGQYIYAYQIFNDYELSDAAISYFSVFEIDHSAMSVDTDSIACHNDSAGGIASTDEYFTTGNTEAVWEFDGGILTKTNHSWFLVYSSDYDWVAGDYEIKTADQTNPLPVGGQIPEPGTWTLISVGGAMLIKRRKKAA